MKRILLTVFFCFSLLLMSFGLAAAEPAAQESADPNVIDAASMLLDLFSAGIGAAAQQLATGGDLPVAAEPTEPPAVPTDIPTAVPTATDVPTAVPTGIPTAIPTATDMPAPTSMPTEEPLKNPPAPEDPDRFAVSTGIAIKDFYDSFKTNVKEGGRHSVSFEEKGGRNASKVKVDDFIELMLHFNKDQGSGILDHLTFKANYKNTDEKETARTILRDMFRTLNDYLYLGLDASIADDALELAFANGSVMTSDLLIYGTAAGGSSAAGVEIRVYYNGSGYVPQPTTSYSSSAEDDFRDLVADLKAEGVVPQGSGEFRFHEDYETEWAQINWYQWDTFSTEDNFVISADITWKSASNTPNYDNSGCGFVFRAQDTSNNLYAAVNMDGNLHFGGIKDGTWLNYGSFRYGPSSTKGSAQMVLVVNGTEATVYIDGSRVGQQRNLSITGDGGLAFTVWSGTNKDYGTRCTFQNVYYYTW